MSIFVQHSKKNKPSKPKKDTFLNTYGSVSKSGIRRTSYHFQTAEPEGETKGEPKTTVKTIESSALEEKEELNKSETIVSPDLKEKEELNKILEQVHAQRGKTKWILGNIGGKIERVDAGKVDGPFTFVGGTNFGPYTAPDKAAAATGLTKTRIETNLQKNNKHYEITEIESTYNYLLEKEQIEKIEFPDNFKKAPKEKRFIVKNDHGIVFCKEVKVEEGTFTFTFVESNDLRPYTTEEEAADITGLPLKLIKTNIKKNSRPITNLNVRFIQTNKVIVLSNKVTEKGKPVRFEDSTVLGPYKTEKEAADVTGLTEEQISDNIKKNKKKHNIKKNKKAKQLDLPVKFKFIYPDPRTLGRHLMVQKRYSFVKEMIKNNIAGDKKHNENETLVAMIEGIKDLKGLYLASKNIGGAAKKYNFTAEQIRDSINKPLPIVAMLDGDGKFVKDITHKHKTKDNKGIQRTKIIILTGKNVTFSWKVLIPLSKEAKDTLKATSVDKQHELAFQICEDMIKKGMFASKNVIDDNRGLIENGFKFRVHGGLFTPSFDRKKDKETVGEQTFYKLHYPELGDALKNIRVVALMANVRYKASKDDRIEWRTKFHKKSLEQYKMDFKNVLEISQGATFKKSQDPTLQGNTPLYGHANAKWLQDKKCQCAFPDTPTKKGPTKKGWKVYWDFLKDLLKEQNGICAVGGYPMSLKSGPWLISPDAIDPLLGHVHGNLRLVCACNNTTDTSKTNTSAENKLPTSLTRKIHDTYWGMPSLSSIDRWRWMTRMVMMNRY